MVPIDGEPLLAHTVCWLRQHGIREIAINVHYRPEAIINYFGDGAGLEVAITYSHEQTVLGTAGAVRPLKSFWQDRAFVIVYGDVLTDLDLSALLNQHAENRRRDATTAATLALYPVPNPTEVGLVDLDETGRITRFVEKPDPDQVFTDLANAGVMVVEPSVIDFIPRDTFYDFGHDLFPALLTAGVSLYGWPIPSGTYLLDIGTPEKYAQAQVDGPRVKASIIRNDR